MNQRQMKDRTKAFARRVIRLCRELPTTREGNLIGGRLFRSGASVGADHRAACRGRSRADFIAKPGIALEEADESLYWMELLMETETMPEPRLNGLMREADELISIFVATLRTSKSDAPIRKSEIGNHTSEIAGGAWLCR